MNWLILLFCSDSNPTLLVRYFVFHWDKNNSRSIYKNARTWQNLYNENNKQTLRARLLDLSNTHPCKKKCQNRTHKRLLTAANVRPRYQKLALVPCKSDNNKPKCKQCGTYPSGRCVNKRNVKIPHPFFVLLIHMFPLSHIVKQKLFCFLYVYF